MKIYISPMAGITDYAYRQIMSKFNPDLVFAEMVNAHLMNIEDKTTITQLLKCDDFKTTGAQIFGHDKEELVNAFLKVESLGFKQINLNMGCPQPKIIKNGSGSALLPRTEFMKDLIHTLKSKLKSDTKLSIKIRVGYKNFHSPEFYIQLANEYKLDFICVHGRTQEQIYSGVSNWDLVSKLSKLPRNIDFIGNGDLFDPENITKKIKDTKLDGIMLARGIVGNPWLIAQTKEYLSSGSITTTQTFENTKNVLLEHLTLLEKNKGAVTASMEINKFIRPYFKQFSENTPDFSTKLREIISEKDILQKYRLINSL